MVNSTPDRRHWTLCQRQLDPWRRRPCSCAELDPVLGPREEEARLLKLAAAMVPAEGK